jgi:hypothetical protein
MLGLECPVLGMTLLRDLDLEPAASAVTGRPLDYLSMSLREFGEMLFARIVFAARFIFLGRSRFPS